MTQATAEKSSIPSEPPINHRWGTPRFGYRANTLMLWLGLHFLWAGYFFVYLAALYFFLFSPKGRRASAHYLQLLHGKSNPSPAPGTYHHMVEFGILLLDRALILARPGHGFSMDCQGLENLALASSAAASRPEPTGIIFLSAHFGMAEISAPYFARMGIQRPVNIVMYQDQKDSTESFHSRHRRMLANVSIISSTDPLAAGLKIIAALRKGEIVAMRADRTLSGKGVGVALLGQPLELPAGPFLSAVLSQAPVLYVYTIRLGYRRYRCIISSAPPFDPNANRETQIAESAQHFATHLESLLRQNPCQWSNFFNLWTLQGLDIGRKTVDRPGDTASNSA